VNDRSHADSCLSFGAANIRAAMLFALAFMAPVGLLADTITNVMSPVVSYQYAALATNVSSSVVSYQYPQDVSAGMLTEVMSPVVSYQYAENFSSEALASGGISSPVISYQYLEWPGNNILRLLYSRTVSYFYQSGSSSGAGVVVSGQVTKANGAGISGALLSATVGLTPVAEATTDTGGNYSLPPLGSGAYVLAATASGYASAARALTLSGSSSVQSFQLTALPSAPSVQQTTSQAPAGFIPPPADSWGSTLKIYDGTSVTNITAKNAPSPNLMTIVLTHGWLRESPNPNVMNTPFAEWPLGMAQQLWVSGLTSQVANILVWDWRYAAEDPGYLGIEPSYAVGHTPDQSIDLGAALFIVLGSNYSQPVHFIGHSLGTIVNAGAINYLHGERTGSANQPVPPTAWPTGVPSIHVTLFDEAQVSEVGGNQVAYDGIDPTALDAWNNAVSGEFSSKENWQSPLPLHFTWADNYISEVGNNLPNAVNVWLQKGGGLTSPYESHGYPMTWYGDSIANPTDAKNPVGFRLSYEYDLLAGLPSSAFLQSTPSDGSTYHQDPSSPDELALVPLPTGEAPLGIQADVIVGGAETLWQNTLAVVGNVTVGIESAAQGAGQTVESGFTYVGGVAAQGQQTLVNLYDSAVLRLNLTTGQSSSGQQLQSALTLPLGVANSDSTSNTPAMVWLPIQIPTNAAAMAFDFIVSGDPSNDSMVCGIGTNNLFSLGAKYIPTNTVSSSSLLDISEWAGTTNELFFGLLGGTSTNASLQIDNIRFYSVQSNGVDSVGDGIPDTWRAQYFPDVDATGTTTNNLSCATCDPDGDGQSNLQEYLAGTDPTNSASALRITAVTRIGADIQVSFTSVNGKFYTLKRCDSIGGAWTTLVDNIPGNDGIQQATDIGGAGRASAFYRVELNQSPNPSQADSDGDGIPDSWMLLYFGHATGQASDHSRATDDADGDGMSNLQEFLAGTDPTSSESVFRILSIGMQGDDVLLTWATAGGRTNAVQAASNLSGTFSNISPNIIITGSGDTTTNYLDPGAATNWPSLFYRIRLVP